MTWFGRPRDPQEQHGFELIGAEIKRRRRALGWSQRVLEAYSGIDQTVISRLENGKQYGIRWSRFALLIDALGGIGASAGHQRRPAVIDLDSERDDLDPEEDPDQEDDPDQENDTDRADHPG